MSKTFATKLATCPPFKSQLLVPLVTRQLMTAWHRAQWYILSPKLSVSFPRTINSPPFSPFLPPLMISGSPSFDEHPPSPPAVHKQCSLSPNFPTHWAVREWGGEGERQCRLFCCMTTTAIQIQPQLYSYCYTHTAVCIPLPLPVTPVPLAHVNITHNTHTHMPTNIVVFMLPPPLSIELQCHRSSQWKQFSRLLAQSVKILFESYEVI